MFFIKEEKYHQRFDPSHVFIKFESIGGIRASKASIDNVVLKQNGDYNHLKLKESTFDGIPWNNGKSTAWSVFSSGSTLMNAQGTLRPYGDLSTHVDIYGDREGIWIKVPLKKGPLETLSLTFDFKYGQEVHDLRQFYTAQIGIGGLYDDHQSFKVLCQKIMAVVTIERPDVTWRTLKTSWEREDNTPPSSNPTKSTSSTPSWELFTGPTFSPSLLPKKGPSLVPTLSPSVNPTKTTSTIPSSNPSQGPTFSPSLLPSEHPSPTPTLYPSVNPTKTPSKIPSSNPSQGPTFSPSLLPSEHPSPTPTISPVLMGKIQSKRFGTQFCLGSKSGSQIHLINCNIEERSSWYLGPNGIISSVKNGTCLQLKNSYLSNASPLELATCSNYTNPNQQWMFLNSGEIKSAVDPSFCIDENTHKREVYMWGCDGTPDQYWTFNATSYD